MTNIETETEAPDTLPAWSLHWRGKVFSESELTGKHLSVLAMIAGNDTFDLLDMNPTLGHQRIMMMLSAFIAVEETRDCGPDEVPDKLVAVLATVADAPAEEILGSIRFE